MEAQVAEARFISLTFELGERDRALGLEWLEAGSDGSYASSTLLGANTRRYHGLLVAPVEGLGRHVMLSWLEEWVEDWLEEWAGDWFVGPEEAPERGSYASCALFAGGGLWPGPLARFERGLISTFHFAVGELGLKKEVFLVPGRRAVAVSYTAEGRCRLKVRPFFACRHFHHLTHLNDQADLNFGRQDGWHLVRPYPELPPVYLAASGRIHPEPAWYLRFHYPEEAARGFDSEEDLLSPGWVSLELAAGGRAWLVAGLEPVSLEEAAAAHEAELARRKGLVAGKDGLSARLALAADQFVTRTPQGPGVTAGYHWFEEWGRDLLVSLPGLFLVDGRVDEALAALSRFAAHLKDGLLPNRLLEEGGADYACADAPLFFLLACQRLSEAAGLAAAAPLWPATAGIIASFQRGTAYGIGVDGDGLPVQGSSGAALTWMDAVVGGEPVTPRGGKAVDMAALWHNGLLFAASLAAHLGKKQEAAGYEEAAARARGSFEAVFWNEERGCCYDVVSPEGEKDAAIRPNQLWAVGLPHAVLTGGRAESVLAVVERELLTPCGLRTLAPGEPGYTPIYGGGVAQRDRAYHQGTVWPWLLGVWADACLKVRGEGAREGLRAILAPLAAHLRQAGVGTVSELFDAEPPYAPRGCIAQAWSVAELRRILSRLERT